MPSGPRPINPAWYMCVLRTVRNGFFRLITGGIRSYGEENLPKTGPVIVAPNHVSNLDPPAVACGTNRRRFRFMAKEELFKGLFGRIIASVGAFPVRRGEGDTESVRLALACLAEGDALLIFPEGARGDGVRMGPINRGVAMLAKRSGAPVVPTGVIGTHLVAPKGQKKMRRHRIEVVYGEPFTFADVATAPTERENRKRFAQELERRIVALCQAHGYDLKTSE